MCKQPSDMTGITWVASPLGELTVCADVAAWNLAQQMLDRRSELG